MKMIVFPGNPGKTYEKTRHNLPWMVLDECAGKYDLVWKNKFNGVWSSVNSAGEKTILLKPLTFVNLSGKSVQSAAAFFKLKPGDITVVHDDIELDYGSVVLKSGGGTAGHNGLRSIVKAMGSSNFRRIRLGISRPKRGDVSSHVLGRFSVEEEAELPRFLKKACDAVESVISEN